MSKNTTTRYHAFSGIFVLDDDPRSSRDNTGYLKVAPPRSHLLRQCALTIPHNALPCYVQMRYQVTQPTQSSGSNGAFFWKCPCWAVAIIAAAADYLKPTFLHPSKHKQGGRSKNSSHIVPTNRGGGSSEGGDDGRGVGASSSATDDPCDADLRDARQPQQQQRTQLYPPSSNADIPPGAAGGGGIGSIRLLPSISTLISRAT